MTMAANNYQEIKAALDAGFDAGHTDDGELVTFGHGPYGRVYRTIFQRSGWSVTQYFLEDGTVEEMYGR